MRKSTLLIVFLLATLTANIALAAPLSQETDGEIYIVQANDWLSKIAEKYYGDMFAYPTIVAATNAKAAHDDTFTFIEDPDLIEIGQVLWIPDAVASKQQQPDELTTQEQFTDPFAYCAAVGTIDMPDQRYTGPEVPEEIVEGVRKASGISHDAPTEWVVAGTVWRCMDGKVWACFVGANLPCTARADTSEAPTVAMENFCNANSNADVIPAAVTGRETVYEWRCTAGVPEIVKQLFEPDAQGFISNFWYEISPK